MAASSCLVNRTFSPVLVDLFSIRMRSLGTPISIAMRRELIRFRLVPQVPRNRAEPAGEDQKRRPPFQEELGAARRHDLVVTAQDQNRIRMRQLMIEVMVIPDGLDESAYPIVHQSGTAPKRPSGQSRGSVTVRLKADTTYKQKLLQTRSTRGARARTRTGS